MPALAGLTSERKKPRRSRGFREHFRHIGCRYKLYFGGSVGFTAGLTPVPAGLAAPAGLAGAVEAGGATPD